MKIVVATIGTFHYFHLARELHRRKSLEVIFTGYPTFKLHNRGVPVDMIQSFPWIQTLYMAQTKLPFRSLSVSRALELWSHKSFDAYVLRMCPDCDVFIGMSSPTMLAGPSMQNRGAKYVANCVTSHPRFYENILKEEYARYSLTYSGPLEVLIRREERAIAAADLVTCASRFARQTFGGYGVDMNKVVGLPLGVNLTEFSPTAVPDPDRFDVLYAGQVCVRKGVRYLLEAFSQVQHPRKKLTFVGLIERPLLPLIQEYQARCDIELAGPRSRSYVRDLMSRSHVMALPTVEDSFGAVYVEALACGCPIIGTTNSGADHLVTDGAEGFVLSIRDTDALRDSLQILASDYSLQRRMAAAASARAKSIGNWQNHGDTMLSICSQLCDGTWMGQDAVVSARPS